MLTEADIAGRARCAVELCRGVKRRNGRFQKTPTGGRMTTRTLRIHHRFGRGALAAICSTEELIGRIFAELSEGGALPETSLKRVLKCDAVALEEASGRQLRCHQSFGVIHLRVDCH